jgi:hypothetical protein
LEVVETVERELDYDGWTGRVFRAGLRSAHEAFLKRRHPIEPTAVGLAVGGRCALRVAHADHRGEDAVQVIGGDGDACRLIIDRVGRPRPGETVGLLLHDDGRLAYVRSELNRVAPFVGDYDSHGGRSEFLGEVGGQILIVVHDEVLAIAAIRRVVLHVAVRTALPSAIRDVGTATGRCDDAAA